MSLFLFYNGEKGGDKMNIQKIPNQILKGKLVPLTLSKVDSIVLHHMAHCTADVKTVERWHINNGWIAIGYNYFVSFDGTVYEGRGMNIGAGVAKHNSHIISIGFQGDYEKIKIMPEAQFNSSAELIKHLLNKIPTAKLLRHSDFGGTVCPGKYFPFGEIKSKVLQTEEEEMIYNYIDENMPEWARDTVKKLVNKGYLKGNENGELGLNDTMLKLLVINDRAGLYKEKN